MRSLIFFAICLMALWIVLRLALAITSGLLHLLWIAAVILFVVWLVNLFRASAT